MKFLRSHIARLTVFIWLGTGLGLFMAQSMQASHSPRGFAQWLSSMAKNSDTLHLEEELMDLQSSSYQLDELLDKASQIVSRNNKDFKFPFAKSAASQQLYKLLFMQWTQFQTESKMAAVPAGTSVKSNLSGTTDYHLATSLLPKLLTHSRSLSAGVSSPPQEQLNAPATLVPMAGGMAINAP